MRSALSLRERGGVDDLFLIPSEKKSFFNIIYIMPEQERLHERERSVRGATFSQNIGRIFTAINMHELDNTLILGFSSAVIVKDVQTKLDFDRRHGGKIYNGKVIAKNIRGI